MIILLVLPIVAILTLVGVILFFLRKWKIGGMVIIVALFLNLWTESIPVNIAHHNIKVSSGRIIRVLTYNTNVSGPYFCNMKDSLTGIISFLDSVDADIMIFQEYDWTCDGGVMGRVLGNKWRYNTKSLGSPLGRTDFVYSKYPIGNFEKMNNSLRIFSVNVILPKDTLYLIRCHLKSNEYTSSRDEGGRSIFRGIKEGYKVRKNQADVIADSIGKYNNYPVMVCGDFNDVSGSNALKTIQSAGDLKDAWWTGGCGFGWTYDAHHLKLRLDHILYSKDFELVNVSVPHVKFSDHYPVVADFIFKK